MLTVFFLFHCLGKTEVSDREGEVIEDVNAVMVVSPLHQPAIGIEVHLAVGGNTAVLHLKETGILVTALSGTVNVHRRPPFIQFSSAHCILHPEHIHHSTFPNEILRCYDDRSCKLIAE